MTEPRQPVPTPAAVAALPVPYERTRWEAAVLAQHLHHRTTAVALILSHYAGPGGILPEDGVQRTDRMRKLTRISHENVRETLRYLEVLGLLQRKPLASGTSPKMARAVVLTIPVRRERPPHPGERP
ncbi:hypothetical protein [Streptomyces stelliscabiei]|uniref:hypothetical protein n=1 Tax=Streptomyces stelliscabiei TaxID=146820 RepID=UPI0029B16ED5|nr:hypothetical protein [Streptomyces stelliscabiei]MDX2551352.1 hypothetical protein [Streptomyces stelliscabiei]